MSAVVTTEQGFEAWCDECGSVAYSTDEWRGRNVVAGAARLHDENAHAPIWLDNDGYPTLTDTGRQAGGGTWLYEHAGSR